MNAFIELMGFAVSAVAPVFLIGIAGALLVKLNAVSYEQLRILGKIVFYLMLPALLATKVSASVSFSQLTVYWIFPFCGIVFVVLGILSGKITAIMCRAKPELNSLLTATIAFPNASYIPIPLMLAVSIVFPCLQENKHAGNIAVTYISVFLIGYSPLMWSVGHALVAARKIRDVKITHIVTPPTIGICIGLITGLTPWLNHSIVSQSGILHPLFNAASVIADGTIPCALLILGGNLSRGPVWESIDKYSIFGTIFSRLIIFPLAVILLFYLLKEFNLFLPDLLLVLTLVVIAASPPANNLVVMASVSNHKAEPALSTLLFWSYLTAIITIPVIITITIKLFS